MSVLKPIIMKLEQGDSDGALADLRSLYERRRATNRENGSAGGRKNNAEHLRLAGRKGGARLKEMHGREYFVALGRSGGLARAAAARNRKENQE